MRSGSTAFLLSLLMLLLGLVAQQAQAQFPGGFDVPTNAPAVSPPAGGSTTPSVTPGEGELHDHDEDEEEEVSVAIDLKVAGASKEQVQAIAALMQRIQSQIPDRHNTHKVNCTVEWKGERKQEGDDDGPAVTTSRRRLLRSYDFGVPPRELVETETCELKSGDTYTITTITLNGTGDKAAVALFMNFLMSSSGSVITTEDGTPLFAFICKSNVRLQSEAPPAEFQPLQEGKKNDAAKIAAIAVPVTLVGVGLIGTAGFFAFKSMSVAAV